MREATETINERFIKSKLILNVIRENQPISRIDIKGLTNIRMATITNITKELIESGIVCEGGITSKSGKPSKKLLYINKDLYNIIGVDLRSDSIIVLISNLEGEVIKSIRKDISAKDNKESILAELFAMVDTILDEYSKEKVIGIGVSLAGALDKDRNYILLSSAVEHISNTAIKPIIEEKYGLPVFADTSNNLQLLAEKWFGHAKKSEDVVYVELGSGIAVSIISNGNILKGYSGIEGELGHTIVESNGKVCVCGNRGCLETVASFKVIEENVMELLEKGVNSLLWEIVNNDLDKVNIKAIALAAEKGDKLSRTVIEEATRYIGISLANIINIVGTQTVIFGGDSIEDIGYFIKLIIKSIKGNTLSYIMKDLEFKITELNGMGGALGAVALVLDDYFIKSKLKNIWLLY